MSSYVWCDKVGQRRHVSICAKLKCQHIVTADVEGFECHFSNAEARRALKHAKKVEAKNATE